MRVECPNGCGSTFKVIVDIVGTADCEVSEDGEVLEVIDTDLEQPDHLQFDEGNWECAECGEQGELVDEPPKKKKGKK